MQILSKYDPATIDDLTSRDEFFWLDLENPGEQVVATLGERFDFHRLALDDALQAGQRPKLQSYDDGRSLFLVYYGADPDGGGRRRHADRGPCLPQRQLHHHPARPGAAARSTTSASACRR